MRLLLNCAISLCLLSLTVVNVAFNPFSPRAYADSESPCGGPPPSGNCVCCDCGCWICDE
jgi:hypothetical protein